MAVTLPDEPDIETIEESDAAKKKMLERKAEMKFKSKFDCWLTCTEKIEKEMKQTYSKYYGQCGKEMKATIAEDPKFEDVHNKKNVITLRKILQSVNLSYRSSEEPIKTMWQAKTDFIKLRQGKHQIVQE
ncbi:MAG: hypothetical protein GY874_16950, partial [Desulfobacteraceae bacterium]|nr:hypothetical protein [Desulfobacteraceae bacterium]